MPGEIFAETEVNHFDAGGIVLLFKHEVLRLNVSVRDVVIVQVHQCGEQLLHYVSCLPFRQVLSLNYEIKKFAAAAVSTGIKKLAYSSTRKQTSFHSQISNS